MHGTPKIIHFLGGDVIHWSIGTFCHFNQMCGCLIFFPQRVPLPNLLSADPSIRSHHQRIHWPILYNLISFEDKSEYFIYWLNFFLQQSQIASTTTNQIQKHSTHAMPHPPPTSSALPIRVNWIDINTKNRRFLASGIKINHKYVSSGGGAGGASEPIERKDRQNRSRVRVGYSVQSQCTHIDSSE